MVDHQSLIHFTYYDWATEDKKPVGQNDTLSNTVKNSCVLKWQDQEAADAVLTKCDSSQHP